MHCRALAFRLHNDFFVLVNGVLHFFFSRSKFPSANENSMEGTAFCPVTASTRTKFSMLHSITFSPFDNMGVSRGGHKQEEPSSLRCAFPFRCLSKFGRMFGFQNLMLPTAQNRQ